MGPEYKFDLKKTDHEIADDQPIFVLRDWLTRYRETQELLRESRKTCVPKLFVYDIFSIEIEAESEDSDADDDDYLDDLLEEACKGLDEDDPMRDFLRDLAIELSQLDIYESRSEDDHGRGLESDDPFVRSIMSRRKRVARMRVMKGRSKWYPREQG